MKTTYICSCGKSVEVYVPVIWVQCSCGKQMKKREQGTLFKLV